MRTLLRDFRYVCRGLAATPSFSLTIVFSLALGIGANTTVFAWLDGIVRHPFPAIPAGGSLVALNLADQDGRVDGMAPISALTLEDWRARLTSFDRIAAHAYARLNLREAPRALGEPVWAELVAWNFFDVLGVATIKGRALTRADETNRAAVIVLSHAFWQRRFGGDDKIIGRSLLFNGIPLMVVGVAPPEFKGVVMGLGFDLWVPMWEQPRLVMGGDWLRDRGARRWQAVARLRPGVSLDAANRELLSVAREVSRSLGESPITAGGARWISDTQLGSLMGPLSLAMLAITAIVLLTACANVAGLLLARGIARRRTVAIQVAIGATRRDLIREALVQACVLGLAGGALGFWIAFGTKDVLLLFVPNVALPVSLDVNLSWRVMVFAATAALLSAIVFALVPALRALKLSIVDALKGSVSSAITPSQSRLRQWLVVSQVAFSLVALMTAALFWRSVMAATDRPLGFTNPRGVLVASTDLSFTRLQGEALARLVDGALDAARLLPGVSGAAFSTIIPLSFGPPPAVTTRIDGYVPGPNESVLVGRAIVSDGYFETMEIRMIEGRVLTRMDRAGGRRTIVVNGAFARRFWPGQSAIGRRVDQGDGWAEVVGVTGDSVVENLSDAIRPLVYHPIGQAMPTAVSLHVRATGDPLQLVALLRRTFADAHPDLPILEPRTLADHMAAGTFVQSVGAAVFGAFGIVALLIAGTGLYGVVATAVAERRREIAVRVAIGASPREVLASVAGPAFGLTAIGLAIGAAIAAGVGTLMRTQLPGVSPLDAPALVVSLAGLSVVAAGTCIAAAWRALRIDAASTLGS